MSGAWWTKGLVKYKESSIKKAVPLINRKYELLHHLSESELLQQIERLRKEVVQHVQPSHATYTAAALVKEAVRRKMGVILHDEQLLGGYAMIRGNVTEMLTGEGKTLTSLIPLFWFGLQGKGVHMITVNPYLAERDYLQAREVFHFLGMTVGLNRSELRMEEKQSVYECEITFGTWSEFGFDYLRDHLIYDPGHQVQRPLAYAIIDEIDSVLIDEAKTPMIIAGKSKAAPDLYYICSKFVKGLRENRDYERDVETNQVMFTESAIRKIETVFMIDNLFDLDQMTVYHYLLQSLRSQVLMEVDRDYLIADGKVHIIDAFTGRVLEGREFGDGLHQAIEVKEGLQLSEETRTNASITVQKYFGLYPQMIGMSGTIKTETEELRHTYGLDVMPISTHRPVVRKDAPDLVFANKEAKIQWLVKEITALHQRGAPILVGTTSVQQSEELAERLSQVHLSCQVLNAKTEREEAEIIGRAGRKSAITIATNMAGRGADIRLEDGVAELGGLHVFGLERHESRRIDLQLSGRSGRQGDPGASQFFISLEDELFQRFASDEADAWRESWKWGEEGASAQPLLRFVDMAQNRAEQQMYSIRTMLYRLDCVVHRQREWFYFEREGILHSEQMEDIISRSVSYWMDVCVERLCPAKRLPEEWKVRQLGQEFGLTNSIHTADLMTPSEIRHQVAQQWLQDWSQFLEAQALQKWRSSWKERCLRLIDQCWIEHMEILGSVKQGIHFRAIEKRDLAEVYEEDAYHLHLKFVRKYHRAITREVIQEMKDLPAVTLSGSA
ncbi:accessory Sec system translocase SecA2 [Paenibacillus luteus]|uniref:preprotein translocase subunit SecA n=1 Tax=Paenibacillus luteus TaxID=2545753 RepID=UPI001144D984|nr:accessory Sec system translocase SecA2 [Paenibacillus luteus]